jgi:choline kinase
MEEYKVFIPCAGVGSRMGALTTDINKCLLSVNREPVLSHLVKKVPDDVEIVIALGYKGSQIKNFLDICYPHKKIQYVTVENYDGEGSSLGHSISLCREHLQCPFVFISNDTFIDGDIPFEDVLDENWIGYIEGRLVNTDYRTLEMFAGKCSILYDKNVKSTSPIYIGVSGIKDYEKFWEAFDIYDDISTGESLGISHLLKDGSINCRKLNWHDCGNINSYNKLCEQFSKDDGMNVLPKKSEAIWFINDEVYKFHIDESFIRDRVERVKFLNGSVPEIKRHNDNIYVYDKVDGFTFSHIHSSTKFVDLLNFCQSKLWRKRVDTPDNFKEKCLSFYKDKTLDRVREYFGRFNIRSPRFTINSDINVNILNLVETRVPWEYLADGIPSSYHGDLHFENILCSGDTYKFLDWRQNFVNYECGDVYYDLAKLNHGLIVNHENIHNDLYFADINFENGELNFDFKQNYNQGRFQKVFFDWCQFNHYDVEKIKILTALIYLNIAALHHNPYCHMLFGLGATQLVNLV